MVDDCEDYISDEEVDSVLAEKAQESSRRQGQEGYLLVQWMSVRTSFTTATTSIRFQKGMDRESFCVDQEVEKGFK